MSNGSAAGAGEGTESKANITKKEKTRTLFNENLDLTIAPISVVKFPVFIPSTPWPQKENNWVSVVSCPLSVVVKLQNT